MAVVALEESRVIITSQHPTFARVFLSYRATTINIVQLPKREVLYTLPSIMHYLQAGRFALYFQQRGMFWELFEVIEELGSRAEQLLASLTLDLVLALFLLVLLLRVRWSR
jgi:hypothetical protein